VPTVKTAAIIPSAILMKRIYIYNIHI